MIAVLKRVGHSCRIALWVSVGLLVPVLVVSALLYVMDHQHFPIRSIQIQGSSHFVDREALRTIVRSHLQRGFFGLDVKSLQQSVKHLDWVRNVAVKRIWPDKLVLKLREYRPVAYWNDNQMLSHTGKIFNTPKFRPKALPVFHGPPRKGKQLWKYYQQMQNKLAKVGLEIVSLSLASRGSWELMLSNGVKIQLGREEVLVRLVRFINVYPKLANTHKGKLAYVDCRYPNGLAVRYSPLVS